LKNEMEQKREEYLEMKRINAENEERIKIDHHSEIIDLRKEMSTLAADSDRDAFIRRLTLENQALRREAQIKYNIESKDQSERNALQTQMCTCAVATINENDELRSQSKSNRTEQSFQSGIKMIETTRDVSQHIFNVRQMLGSISEHRENDRERQSLRSANNRLKHENSKLQKHSETIFKVLTLLKGKK